MIIHKLRLALAILLAMPFLAACAPMPAPTSTPGATQPVIIPTVTSVPATLTVAPTPQLTPPAGKTVAAAAQCYFDAVANNDLAALTACFTPDAVVIDVSREIKGIDAIRQWANNEVLGGRYEILESESRPGGVRLIVRFIPKGSSTGFRAAYIITFKEGRIAKMDLQYA